MAGLALGAAATQSNPGAEHLQQLQNFALGDWTITKREQVRTRFGIPGTPLKDCCTAFWCPYCAVIQHDKEVATRMPKPMDLLKQQPLPEPEMTMPGAAM
ncbi:hypothetical protein F4808DRAFT_465574 [Astrocystis sublimbata]|nr:hypothetical protein F4808DRAFT_465574 [Astrocystis sublimbata]